MNIIYSCYTGRRLSLKKVDDDLPDNRTIGRTSASWEYDTGLYEFSFDACCVKLRFCEMPFERETKPSAEPIPISEAVREGRRRDKDTWSYTLSSEPALFADRGFTAHEFILLFRTAFL